MYSINTIIQIQFFTGRDKKECMICKKMVVNLSRHLKSSKHKIEDPHILLSSEKNYRKSRNVKVLCPLCKMSVTRLTQHFVRGHKLSENEIKKLKHDLTPSMNMDEVVNKIKQQENKNINIASLFFPASQSIEHKVQIINEDSSMDLFEFPTTSQNNVNINQSTSNNTTSKFNNSDDDDGDNDDEYLVEVNEIYDDSNIINNNNNNNNNNAKFPDQLKQLNISKKPFEININSEMLDEFKSYLDSMNGGFRVNSSSNVSHMIHLTKYCGSNLRDFLPTLVCEKYFNVLFSECVVKENEDGERRRKRKPSSVMTYLYSIKSFVEFMYYKWPFLKETQQFKEWPTFISKWLKTLKKESYKYAAEKEDHKLKNSLKPSFYRSYLNSRFVERLEKEMLKESEINCSENFLLFRNHLIVKIVTENAARPCVITHFKMSNVNEPWEKNKNGGCTFLVDKHKTAYKYGCAALVFSKANVPLFRKYLKVIKIKVFC